MFDPAISDSVNLFVIIAVSLIAFVKAVIVVDVYKKTAQKKDTNKK